MSRQFYKDADQKMTLHCLLGGISNNDVSIDVEAMALLRRCLVGIYTNHFYDEDEMKEHKGEEGAYFKNIHLLHKWNTTKHSMAMLHLLREFIQYYITKGKLQCAKQQEDDFKKLSQLNDEFSDFVNRHFVRCEDGRVSKTTFLDMYRAEKRNNLIKMVNITTDLRRIKLDYKDQYKMNGVKGVILGIKLKCDFDDTDDAQLDVIVENEPTVEELEKQIALLQKKLADIKQKNKPEPKKITKIVEKKPKKKSTKKEASVELNADDIIDELLGGEKVTLHFD